MGLLLISYGAFVYNQALGYTVLGLFLLLVAAVRILFAAVTMANAERSANLEKLKKDLNKDIH